MNEIPTYSYSRETWKQFKHHRLGVLSLLIIACFTLIGIYAPFLASSKPILVVYDGQWFFPLFRYLFYRGFFTKYLDLFFNLLIFTFPLFLIALSTKRKKLFISFVAMLQIAGFFYVCMRPMRDPASDPTIKQMSAAYSWQTELKEMNDYAKLNQVVEYTLAKEHHETLMRYAEPYLEKRKTDTIPTLFSRNQERIFEMIERLKSTNPERANYFIDRQKWLQNQSKTISFLLMPLIRPFHWEDDAGGSQLLNRHLPMREVTRINRRDMTASLIFGVRISLVVGVVAVCIALALGVPTGAVSGYFGGRFDLMMSRFVEIWESMPSFFMLLFIVSITQSKSIFLVITIIGIFGWTSFWRYTRGEFFKQRNLLYVEACHSLGLRESTIMFRHILPNAVPPLLTLLPFAIMGAITSEAGLSFLGLGEEDSASWGVLMDEGRQAFPGESYLLWPPAILLSLLLIAIALVGDAARDALDPKMHRGD